MPQRFALRSRSSGSHRSACSNAATPGCDIVRGKSPQACRQMEASGSWFSLLSRIAAQLVVALAPTALCAQPADSRAAERSEVPERHAVLLVRAALPVPEETAVKSYLGGLPRMPSHFEWPIEAPFGEPRALTFVAQVALSEIPEFPQRSLLPDAGTLYFFVSSDFDGVGDPASAVLYFEDEAAALPI